MATRNSRLAAPQLPVCHGSRPTPQLMKIDQSSLKWYRASKQNSSLPSSACYILQLLIPRQLFVHGHGHGARCEREACSWAHAASINTKRKIIMHTGAQHKLKTHHAPPDNSLQTVSRRASKANSALHAAAVAARCEKRLKGSKGEQSTVRPAGKKLTLHCLQLACHRLFSHAPAMAALCRDSRAAGQLLCPFGAGLCPQPRACKQLLCPLKNTLCPHLSRCEAHKPSGPCMACGVQLWALGLCLPARSRHTSEIQAEVQMHQLQSCSAKLMVQA